MMADHVLSSWNDGAAKSAIVDFVARVTKEGGPDFVPPAERIATFDNDGTLWCEQPMQVQVFFLIDRVKELAANGPGDERAPAVQGVAGARSQDAACAWQAGDLVELVVRHPRRHDAKRSSIGIARAWFATAKTSEVRPAVHAGASFQPQIELLDYLRHNGFKTYIVSGGGVDFMRAFAEEVYGIPREQVIGSSVKTRFEMTGRAAVS